ncbi:hypothetical protein EB155_14415, partial [archaeon]|nr:hypothetical protein [archaeon]
TVTVTDANNCTATNSIVITEPTVLNAANITSTNVSCLGGANGTATVTPSGGTSPYTYSWTTAPAQTVATATGLTAGSYNVTVTDANNCTTTGSVTITEPAVAISLAASAVDASCLNGTDGSVTVIASGGTTPYSYSWNTTPPQLSQTVNSLGAGTYTVTVTDANNCSTTAQAVVNEPTTSITITVSGTTDASCFGNGDGGATVSASGGTAPYTYSWATNPVKTTATVSGLAAGNYSVTATDNNGCSSTQGVTIGQPAVLTVPTPAKTNVSCFGGGDGTATVSPTGGTAPYTYAWSNGQNTATATGLSAGTYTVTVTDANNCTATNSIVITEPTVLNAANITSTN